MPLGDPHRGNTGLWVPIVKVNVTFLTQEDCGFDQLKGPCRQPGISIKGEKVSNKYASALTQLVYKEVTEAKWNIRGLQKQLTCSVF